MAENVNFNQRFTVAKQGNCSSLSCATRSRWLGAGSSAEVPWIKGFESVVAASRAAVGGGRTSSGGGAAGGCAWARGGSAEGAGARRRGCGGLQAGAGVCGGSCRGGACAVEAAGGCWRMLQAGLQALEESAG